MVMSLGYGITFPIVWAPAVRACVAFPVVGFILIALRLNARRWQKRKLGADDIFGILAWIALAVMGGIFVYGANNRALGWREPPPDGNAEEQIAKNSRTSITKLLLRLQYIFQIFMILALGFTKLSLLWFCRRLFVVHRRGVSDIITIGLTCLVSVWTLAYFFAYVFYCKGHPSAFWGTPLQEKKYCLAIANTGRQLQYSMTITDMILDLCCVIIPFPIIWRLHLTTSQKAWVFGIFSLGLMTIAASIARIVVFFQVDETAKAPKEDIFLGSTLTLYWSMLEAGLAYIASQLPALSQYLTHFTSFPVSGYIHNAVSWFSLGGSRAQRSRSEPTGNHDTNGQFHEMKSGVNGASGERSGSGRRDSDATAWSAPSQPEPAKTKDQDGVSENSLLGHNAV